MKRHELTPGTYFRYDVNPVHVYWTPDHPGPHRMPPGLLVSGPNPISTDWNQDVTVVTPEDAKKFSEEWSRR